jgi:hypothetical protein
MTTTPAWWIDPRDLHVDLAKIEQQWSVVREILDDPEPYALRDAQVSGWSCGEQAGHIVLVALAMARTIEANLAEPDRHVDGAWTEFTGRILEAGRFPRGRAESPPQLAPAGHSREDFVALLEATAAAWARIRARADEVAACPARARHFTLGYLTSAEWVRMCAVHTAHHLAIVRDIRGEGGGEARPPR